MARRCLRGAAPAPQNLEWSERTAVRPPVRPQALRFERWTGSIEIGDRQMTEGVGRGGQVRLLQGNRAAASLCQAAICNVLECDGDDRRQGGR